MYYVYNNHEAIVTREQFNKVQEELLRRNTIVPKNASKAISAQGRYSRYALTEIMHCDECGSRYKRCTWAKKGVRKIVWRCMSRIEHGTQYCKNSPSLEESKLHQAIVRAINRFNQENETTVIAAILRLSSPISCLKLTILSRCQRAAAQRKIIFRHCAGNAIGRRATRLPDGT